ncbi:EAL domain-containing protein [Agarivorans sp. TSD2052]|uniref:EAL domain-containing protein n=1 Tax=Agarivorans sp. TSD2052 TaxID=2937286 RepID=UPI00200C4529|nr:EAL domain-containing protein [Agarivorans sp. TSD2052]UPW16936.1 EAL domain-containing protein [Agarivorans sp. TSD2052]
MSVPSYCQYAKSPKHIDRQGAALQTPLYNIKIVLLGLALLSGLSFSVQANNILVIHSYHNEHFWTGYLKQGLDNAFKDDADTRLFHEYMDAKRYPKSPFKLSFLDYLNTKYANTNLDVIVISDDPAFNLIREHREQFFNAVPIVYLGINRVSDEVINTPNMTGVFENRDIAGTIVSIKQQTGIDELILIVDQTSTGLANLAKAKMVIGQPEAPKKIHIIEELIEDNIPDTFSHFNSNIPVLLIGQLTSPRNNNALLSWNQGTEQLVTWTNNPVYTIAITTLEYGAVGADELDGRQHATRAAGLVKRILAGEALANIPPITTAKSQWIYNWEKLREHNYSLESLPSDARIINKEETFYEKYKLMVRIVASAFIASIFIIILLMEVIRRGSITRHLLAENESRYRDLAKAGANIFWETDPGQRFSYVSGDTQTLFGIPEQRLMGHTISELCRTNPNMNFPWLSYEKAIAYQQPLSNLVFKLKMPSKDIKIFLLNGKPIFDKNKTYLGYRGISKEITEEHLLTKKLAYQAAYDSLTGLINRSSFNEQLKSYVQQHQDPHLDAYLCFLDLDRFKLVNDTAGHLIGDAMLAEVATVISQCISKQDIIGRLGGDEFGLILVNKSLAEAQALCEDIIAQVKDYRFVWNQRMFNVGISIGMVPVTGSLNETELLSKADLSCYKAKEEGRGRVYIANLDNDDLFDEEQQMGYIANVAQAIEQQQFYLVKQVISSLDTGNNKQHYEILIRYRDDQGKTVPPSLFIPAAEKHSVITIIDQWVLETVFERYHQYFPDGDTVVSINLSGISLSNDEFVSSVINLVKNSSVNPKNICFEITETVAISQLSRALDFMREMKALGIKFALDDFGSGASSFTYLKSLPVDYLKIDGSLIVNIVSEPTDRAIVESINAIAHMMNMKTVAEFVENQAIQAVLEEIGVDYVQGYGIGKPKPCEPNL